MVLRSLSVAAAGLLLLAGGAAGRPAGGTPVAFVAVPARGELVAVDLSSARVAARLRVPGPAEVAWAYDSWRGRPVVLVTSPSAGAVSLVDAVSRRATRVWRALGAPRDVAVEGTEAYVTDGRGGRLLVLGVRSRRLLAQLPVGAGADAVAVSDVALVARGPALVLADVRARALTRVPLPERAVDVVERPDSADAYVTFASGRLAHVDWGRHRVRALGRPAARAAGAAFDVFAGDRLWVADRGRGRIVLVDVRAGRVLRRLAGCPEASRVALGGTAWVVASCADGLAVWDTRRWRRRTVPLGGRPLGVDVAVLP